MKTVYDVIIEPILTEKSDRIKEKLNMYTFKVAINATKTEIKQAIEKIFKVKVEKVNIIRNHGKTRRRGFRYTYKEPGYKKAIVKIKSGQKIEFFEGI